MNATPKYVQNVLVDTLTRGEKLKISRMRGDLLKWFRAHGRDLPWRSPSTTTFERICVEILLQRTRVEMIAPMYLDFFSRFKSWHDIANTSREELEEILRPLGLWRRRASSLKALASYASEHDGLFPACPSQLTVIPAVGQYVMNAILLFQHGQPRPLLDVNMARLLERFIRPRDKIDLRYDPWLQAAAHWLVRGENQVAVNWAALDFASLVCQARKPRCETCMLRSRCNYFRRH